MENNDYRVLLYYKYRHIDDVADFVDTHLKYCKNIGLLGRVLVATEGINGTVSGTVEMVNAYITYLKSINGFEDTFFKIDHVSGHTFKKMHVRAKKELVNLSLEEDINPLELTGKHLEPSEFMEALKDPNAVVIDARNDYEYDLGHFRGAIKPEIRNFRDLPGWMRENKEKFEGKKILTYCTGGVRCEKFSGWLLKEGYEDVAQLNGGIHNYGTHEDTKGALWDGKMYVFDERIAVDINKHEKVVVGKDFFTGEPCERYINCGNPDCNKQILASESSEQKYLGSCSDSCRLHPRNRYVIKHNIPSDEVRKIIKNLNLENYPN